MTLQTAQALMNNRRLDGTTTTANAERRDMSQLFSTTAAVLDVFQK